MSQQNVTRKYWNVFAFELSEVLHKYDMDLKLLEGRTGIHREKVRRLTQSLHTPPSLPMLNPEETQAIIDTLQISPGDVLQLRAAILATAVQRTLSDRVAPDDAWLAAVQILPIILQALIKHASDVNGLGNAREGTMGPIEDSGLDMLLDAALAAMDRGSEALQMSYYVNSYVERVKKARTAHGYYQDAIAELKSVSRTIHQSPTWQVWHNDAQKGLRAATTRLEELGAE